ncbi:MAG: hypothetical protein ACREQT_11845 [Candidatus Binataceae bacterium]
MLGTETHPSSERALSEGELAALKLANENGWLTVTSDVGERVLARWQHECARLGRPLAMIRPEPKRATLWFVPTSGRDWTSEEQACLRTVLADSTGFILTGNQARAFAPLGAAATLMLRLLVASALSH